MDINNELKEYIETKILPQYSFFDKGHKIDHANAVIDAAIQLSSYYDVDINLIYTAAAFHDIGLQYGRKFHHIHSGRIIREDKILRKWFNNEQIETIAEAAEDHRASINREPRTIYGKIIAEADRLIIPEVIIQRAIQYSLINNPELGYSSQYEIVYKHMIEKYGEKGYLKLWIPESPNYEKLIKFRKILNEPSLFKDLFDKIYNKEEKEKYIMNETTAIQRTNDFLKECKYYFLATTDINYEPRVRPFGTINIFENRLYIQTGKGKDVAKQIEQNAKFEICAFNGTNKWIRISGLLIKDENIEAIKSMLEAYPELSGMYNENNTIVYYFKDAIVRIFEYGKQEERYSI